MPQKKIEAPNRCLSCGSSFEVYPWQLSKGWGKFCSRSCGVQQRTKERNAYWHGDEACYETAHYRLKEERGLARNQVCSCGNPANEWAYDHTDPDQKVCPKGRPYSFDHSRYEPLCRHCHRVRDGNRKKQERVP